MKNLFKGFRSKNLLCGLCIALASVLLPFPGSFIFLGEPAIPECLKKE